MYYIETPSKFFVPNSTDPHCATESIRLPSVDFWTFRVKDFNPPRLTFHWPNADTTKVDGKNFTISWKSSEYPHFDRCQLVTAGITQALNCSDSNWR